MRAELGVAIGAVTAIFLPHVLPLRRGSPRSAAVLLLGVLALRAAVSIAAAVFVLLYLPRAELLQAVADWCLHAVLPLLATHLGLSGHGVGHLAAVLPGLALAASLLWVLGGLLRASVALRSRLHGRDGRRGPLGSTVVSDPDVLVAIPLLGRARIVVSERAVSSFDEQELRASLVHELGHLRRRHRPVFVAAAVLSAIARPVPGTRAAESELHLHLERDADGYAVGLTQDPLALASAICKAAGARVGLALAAVGGRGRLGVRLEYLLEREGPVNRHLDCTVRAAAMGVGALALFLFVTLPVWALAAPRDIGLSLASAGGLGLAC